MNPQLLVDVTGEAALKGIADEVSVKLQAAIDSLTATEKTAKGDQ
jgi:hypothetical protein